MTKTFPLLITLDLHQHRQLDACVIRSAEFFTHYAQRVTYFVPAMYVRRDPELGGTLRRVRAMGHTIGCHGLNHATSENLNAVSPTTEFTILKDATKILQDTLGEPITCFRAPCFLISSRTLPILAELGYRADLSVTPQHFPLLSSSPWAFGRLIAPRSPYQPSEQSPFRSGRVPLLEIPTSCLGVPFQQGTILSIPTFATNLMTNILISEARCFNRVLVTYLHPESIVGKDDWKWPPLTWRDFVPFSSGGTKLRYRLIERDPVVVQNITLRFLARLRSETNFIAISVDDFLSRWTSRA